MGFDKIHQKPLNQEVEYDIEDHLIYGKQKLWKKIIEWVLTILGWSVLLTYVVYLIYGSLAIKYGWPLFEFFFYTREMVLVIQEYFFIYFIAFLIFGILLIVWKNYNYHKFGKLHRRTFQPSVSNEELSEMFELDPVIIEKMQSERYVVIEQNIIPADLGMGGKDKKEEKKEEKKSQRPD